MSDKPKNIIEQLLNQHNDQNQSIDILDKFKNIKPEDLPITSLNTPS